MSRARQLVLTKNSTGKEVAASPCVNPVVDRWWDFRGHTYHVKGLHKSVEEVKERNGPFAGKRVSRPVADYEACHSVVLTNTLNIINNKYEHVLKVKPSHLHLKSSTPTSDFRISAGGKSTCWGNYLLNVQSEV